MVFGNNLWYMKDVKAKTIIIWMIGILLTSIITSIGKDWYSSFKEHSELPEKNKKALDSLRLNDIVFANLYKQTMKQNKKAALTDSLFLITLQQQNLIVKDLAIDCKLNTEAIKRLKPLDFASLE